MKPGASEESKNATIQVSFFFETSSLSFAFFGWVGWSLYTVVDSGKRELSVSN